MPVHKPFLAAALLLGASAPALANFAPGRWQHRTQLVEAHVPGVPQWLIRLFASRSARENCHDAGQLAKRPEALLTQDDAAVCTARQFSLEHGRIAFDTFCTNRRFPDGLLVSSRGTWTPDRYEIASTATGTRNGKPVLIRTTGTGRHVAGTCKHR